MIDSHTHLDRSPGTDAELVAAAREAGLTRILTVGTDTRSNHAAIAAAEAHDEVFAAVGRHPNDSTGYEDAVTDELRELARHPKVLAIGETGLDDYRNYAPRPDQERAFRDHIEIARHPRCAAIGETGLDDYRDYAPRPDQERAFAAHIGLARELAKPLVIHTRAADDDTIATLARDAQGLDVILHCFSMPDRLDECLAHGWWISFAGNVTYPKARELAFAAERAPLDRVLVETDAPYLTPQAVRKERNQPAYVVHTARFIAERRGIDYAALETAVHENSARLFGW